MMWYSQGALGRVKRTAGSFCCYMSAQSQDDRDSYVLKDYIFWSQRWRCPDIYHAGNMYTKHAFFTNLKLLVQLDGTNTQ